MIEKQGPNKAMGADPAGEHYAREGPHVNESVAETGEDVAESVKEKLSTVSRAEFEEFVAQAVRTFLRGGLHVHHEGHAIPDFEIKLTDDTVVVNLRNLDAALSWDLASGPADVQPPEPRPEQMLDHFRVFVMLEDEPVMALGRGIPGLQLRTGRASFILFKDLVKGILSDKDAASREKARIAERERLEEEIEYSRKRSDAVPEYREVPPRVEPGQEHLPGPEFEPHGPGAAAARGPRDEEP